MIESQPNLESLENETKIEEDHKEYEKTAQFRQKNQTKESVFKMGQKKYCIFKSIDSERFYLLEGSFWTKYNLQNG